PRSAMACSTAASRSSSGSVSRRWRSRSAAVSCSWTTSRSSKTGIVTNLSAGLTLHRPSAQPRGVSTGRELTEEQQQTRRQAVRELMPQTPYLASLGIVFDRWEPDDVVLRLPFRPELTNDGTYYHGGVIASAIDTA